MPPSIKGVYLAKQRRTHYYSNCFFANTFICSIYLMPSLIVLAEV